jgi:hypothetical protein
LIERKADNALHMTQSEKDQLLDMLRIGAFFACGFMAAWFLYLAAFHSWLSWGPPTPYPEWHKRWSIAFFCISIASGCCALMIVALPFLKRREKRREAEAATRSGEA